MDPIMKKTQRKVNVSPTILGLLLLMCAGTSYSATIAGIPDGSGSVNGVGGFTYNIPIKVASGIANLSPVLATRNHTKRGIMRVDA